MSLRDNGKWDYGDAWREMLEEDGVIPKTKISENVTKLPEEKIYTESDMKRIVDKTIVGEYDFYNETPKGVFNKARRVTEANYRRELSKNSSRIKKLPEYETPEVKRRCGLQIIQELELESKTSLTSNIKCRFKAIKMILAEDGDIRVFWKVLAYVVALTVILLLMKVEDFNSFKDAAFYFAKSISSSCLDVSILMIVCFIYNVFKRHKTSRVLYVSLILSLVIGSFHIPFVLGIGTTQIGDYYELTEYTEYYYVQMSRNPETDANRKVYTLPAEICRSEDFEGYTEIKEDFYGNTYGGREIYKTNYHINYLYFNNGGYLCFSDNDPERNAVVLNKEIKIQDYHDETFYITLTANKADVSSIAIRATANKGSE